MRGNTIKLYVSCHKECYVPVHSLLYPIQVGTALSERRFKGMLHDDTGDTISEKNKSYCELTAQFWAWKNEEADYFGLFHYRRFLYIDECYLLNQSTLSSRKWAAPYKILNAPTQEALNKLGYEIDAMSKLILSYDIIAPIAEEMYVSVYNHYKNTEFHYIEDLDMILSIILEKYPTFKQSADEYMSNTKLYLCNMFIMKKDIFHSYCAWLFDILTEFDQNTDFSKYKGKACRVDGYLGERLFGIYYTWLKKQQHVRYAELPRAHFEAFPGETDNFSQMKIVNTLLPPGTRRRALVKRILK